MDVKSMTQAENDRWFYFISNQILKNVYENGSLEERASLYEKRAKLKKPDNLIKRFSFDPEMKIEYKNNLPKWWHDTLKAARGRQYEEKQDEFGEGYR